MHASCAVVHRWLAFGIARCPSTVSDFVLLIYGDDPAYTVRNRLHCTNDFDRGDEL